MDEENSFVALEGPQICLSLPPIDFALLLHAINTGIYGAEG